jgi:ketosteroid isomerase-like protein
MQITESDRVAIRSVIERQLEAFQNEDAISAFAFASPGIQQTFQTPENFLEMVKNYYGAVYRPRSVVFDDLAIVNDTLAQPVLLLGPDAVPVRALYLMERQLDSTWRIHGCHLVPIDDNFEL